MIEVPVPYRYASKTAESYDPFLRRHSNRRPGRTPRRISGRVFTARRLSRPVGRTPKKPIPRAVAPFRMVLPRQKPPMQKPPWRFPFVPVTPVSKPKKITVPKKVLPTKVVPPKPKRSSKPKAMPKMISMNFPAPSAAPPRGSNRATADPDQTPEETMPIKENSPLQEQKKKKQKATMIKIGVTAVVALAAVWYFTSSISKTKTNGHTR